MAATNPNINPNINTTANDPAHPNHSAATGLKGVFAGIHGAGEALRGTVNSAVDEVAGDAHGKAKNDAVTVGGVNEMESGQFTQGTKNREGVVPGDQERRF